MQMGLHIGDPVNGTHEVVVPGQGYHDRPGLCRGWLDYGPFLKEEESMTSYQIKRLIQLHERVQRHLSAYWRFSADLNMQSKALSHLRKAARLHSHIAAIIGDSASVP